MVYVCMVEWVTNEEGSPHKHVFTSLHGFISHSRDTKSSSPQCSVSYFLPRSLSNILPVILGGKVTCYRVLAASGRRGGFTQPFHPILRGKRYSTQLKGED